MKKNDQPSAESFEFEEEDILDLTETLQEDDIIDLDSPANSSEDQGQEDVYDLDDFLAEKGGLPEEDEVIDLVEPMEPEGLEGVEDEEIIDLLDSLVEDDDVIELMEPVTQVLDDDEIIDLSIPVDDDEETIIDLTQTMHDDEVLDLVKTVDGADIVELTERIEPESDFEDEVVELSEVLDDDGVIDLTNAVEDQGRLGEETLELLELDEDEEILDLTQEIEAGLEDTTIDLTQEIGESFPIENQNDDDVIDLVQPTTVLDDDDVIDLGQPTTVLEDDDVIDLVQPETNVDDDDDILELDQTLVEDFEAADDGMDDRTLEGLESSTIKDFAEQTSDNLQFDLADSVLEASSTHTIINAEPVKDSFDFESFAEQTHHMDRSPGSVEPVSRPDSGSRKDSDEIKAGDIESEIRNLSFDTLDLDGLTDDQIENVDDSEQVSMPPRVEEPALTELDATEIIDHASGQDRESEDDFFEKTLDDSLGQTFDETVELDYEPEPGLDVASGDEDQAIAEVLGIDVSDMKGGRNAQVAGEAFGGMISQAQLDLAVERVIRKLYGEKLDEIFREVVGKAISEDIGRIREALKKES